MASDLPQRAQRKLSVASFSAGKKSDDLGIWRTTASYQVFAREPAAQVFQLACQPTFIAIWAPTAAPQRVLFLLHGTGGSAYDEFKDEIEFARKNNIALVAVQWRLPPGERYLRPHELFPVLTEAASIVGRGLRWPTPHAGILGFSRGAAVLPEVAALNSQMGRLFDHFVLVSGGVPDSAVLAPGEPPLVDPFFEDFNRRCLPSDLYRGLKFWLYSGMKDEEWGTTMSRYMHNTCDGIKAFGGEVVAWVNDPNGTHMGPKEPANAALHQQIYDFLLDR